MTAIATKEPPDAAAAAPHELTYFQQTQDLAVSLILVLPLLVLYQAGLFLIGFQVVNGADLATRWIFPAYGTKGLVLFNLGALAVFLAAIIRLERQRRFHPSLFPPLVLESTIYASVLGSVILYVLERLMVPLSTVAVPQALTSAPTVQAIVLSVGAGVNEEIVFRLVLLSVLQYIFADFIGLSDRAGAIVSVITGALLFSAAHYVGAHGDEVRLGSFLFRTLAGVIFALLYRYRSFAVAVYTHAIYDVFVLLPRS